MGRAGNATFLVVGQSMQALGFGAISLFLPLIRQDLDITFSQAGLLSAAATLFYAVMMVPAGYLGDRFNPKTIFVVGLIGVNLTSILFAVVTDFGTLMLVQAVSGLFRSLLFGPGMILISAQFSPERRATAMGLFVAGGLSSNVLLNLLGPVLIQHMTWQWILITFSATALFVGVLYGFLGTPVTRNADDRPKLSDIPRLLREPVVWTTGIIQFVRLAVAIGFSFWLPTLLVEDKGFTLVATGFLIAIGALIAAPANIIGGIISDRTRSPLKVIGLSLFMLALTSYVLGIVQTPALVIAVVLVNAVFLQLYFGPLFAVPLQFLGGQYAGVLSSLGNLMANVGALVATLLMGAIKDYTGSFAVALNVIAGLCLLGVLVTYLTSRLKKPHIEGESEAVEVSGGSEAED